MATVARRPQEKTWLAAQQNNTPTSYRAYLTAYPKGDYKQAATDSLAYRRADSAFAVARDSMSIAAFTKFDSLYSNSRYKARSAYYTDSLTQQHTYDTATTVTGWQVYADKYTNGFWLQQAQQNIKKWGDAAFRKKDDDAWTKATKANTITAYETYKKENTEGLHLADADTKIKDLRDAAARQAANDKIALDKLQTDMVYVAGGTFNMGSNDGGSDEKPVHAVTVSNFYIGKYEVTQAQWRAVMGSNPAWGQGVGDNYPVYYVSWDDIQMFLKKLKDLTGKTYRLPTEAEWEYAAGGGKVSRTKWAGTDNENSLSNYAWYSDNSGPTTHPVGQKNPNGLGLYDMSGNVWEWCQDWFKGYPDSSGVSDYTGSRHVSRGGGWGYNGWSCRVAVRSDGYPDGRRDYVGFRLVFVP